MKSSTEKLKFIRSVFGEYSLSRNERDAAVRCPSCSPVRGKRKLSIRIEDDFYHCWVCGIKGRNLVPLLKKFGSTASLSLYKKNFLGSDGTCDEEEEVRRATLPDDFTLLFHAVNNDRNPDFKACLNYLISRGITERDIWFYKLGVSALPGFSRRIIFPSFDADGKLNFVVTRAVDNHVIPKYLNCNVDRNDIVFNELFIDWSDDVVVVEGPFDMIKANHNAVPLLGSGLSESSALFKRIAENKSTVYLSLDSDARKKTDRIAKLLTSFGCNVNIIPMGSFADVGEMTPAQFLERKECASQWTQWTHVLDKIDRLN